MSVGWRLCHVSMLAVCHVSRLALCHVSRLALCHEWPALQVGNPLNGLVVKAFASRAEDPGFYFRLLGICPGPVKPVT